MDPDEQVERAGCAEQYEALQLCMADNDRDWRKVSHAERRTIWE